MQNRNLIPDLHKNRPQNVKKVMQNRKQIPDLHKNAAFSGLLQFALGPALFQNRISQGDGGRAEVAAAPHLAAEGTDFIAVLHAPCPLAGSAESCGIS